MEIDDKTAAALFAGNLFNIRRLMSEHYPADGYLHALVSLGEKVHRGVFEHVWANPTYHRWQEVYNDPTNRPGIRRNAEWQLYQTILHELAVVGFTIPGNDRWSVTVKLSNKHPDIYDVLIHPVAMTVIRKYPDSTMGLTTAFDKLAMAAELISNGYNPHDLGIEQ